LRSLISSIPGALYRRALDTDWTLEFATEGLAIVRSIVVDKHGGSIACASEVGCETTFTIRLPIGDVGGQTGAEA
jgi:signal transduction histidine kinase